MTDGVLCYFELGNLSVLCRLKEKVCTVIADGNILMRIVLIPPSASRRDDPYIL